MPNIISRNALDLRTIRTSDHVMNRSSIALTKKGARRYTIMNWKVPDVNVEGVLTKGTIALT